MQDQLTTVNILSLFQTNKAERLSFVSDVLDRIESGEADPIKVHAQVKKMEEIVKVLSSNESYKAHLLDAVERNGKKFVAFDAEWSVKELGSKFDYSYCGDVELLMMQEQAEKLAIEIKEKQEFLKKAKATGTKIIVEETGEVMTVYPPSKSSTTGVVVSLK